MKPLFAIADTTVCCCVLATPPFILLLWLKDHYRKHRDRSGE